MLKVVLVDDEAIIREGLASGMDWESLGFKIVGQAEDGEHALQVIEETIPDVIVTDIKMPFMDGLQLIENLKPKYPQLCVIIISGHDEFQYAQKALKLGAFDYILKPIDLDYLQVLLKNIKAHYETEKKKEGELRTLQEKIANSLPLLKERLFKDIIDESIDPAEIELKMIDLKINPGKSTYYLAYIVQLDDYYIVTKDMNQRQQRSLESSFVKLIRNICVGDQAIVISAKAIYEPVIILFEENKENLDDRLYGLLKEIHYKVAAQGQYTVTVGIGNVYDQVEMVAKSYQEATASLDYKFILGKNRDLYFGEIKNLPMEEPRLIDYDESELISDIRLGEKKAIRQKLSGLIEGLRRNSGSYSSMRILVSGIYLQALKILKEAGGSGEEVFNDPLEIYHQVISCQTAEDMVSELIEVLFRISDYIYIKKTNKFFLNIEKAKEFLKKNYAKEGLTLEEVSRFVNMSSCYLSFAFKQEVGVNFVDYLNQIRLEKAKELLMVSDCKSYEVSYMVGYNNPTYFSTIFKKHVGVSPTEFKNQYMGESGNKK